ncbi:MAG: Na+/H+ antiporter [Anaerolineales bacterium]|nr:Na+/H+ antiporter [Anaerolineales bacterium]
MSLNNSVKLLSHHKILFYILSCILLLLSLAACSPANAIDFGEITNIDSSLFSVSVEETPLPEDTSSEQTGDTLREETSSLADEAEEQFLLIEEIVIGLLFLAVVVGMVAYRLRLPYTVGLVIIGLLLTFVTPVDIKISPTVILALLIPPLIFEAAFHLKLDDLRNNLAPILVLAIPGVILTTLLVGGIVSWGTGLAIPVAMVFGALIAATDPVSVVALFRTMGVPKRLQVLLEGESLFNDGTAIVVFDLVVVIAVSGAASFSLLSSVVDFVRVAGGGLIVGILLGALISQMISRIDDYLIETTLTSVLAFGSYLVAEILGVSGVLAVVAAGLVAGNIGPTGMSPTTRIVLVNFWEYAAFVANSFVFLLIGLQIELPELFENWQLILWAILAVLVARGIGVYGLSFVEREIPFKWRHVLFWGGLRGAISLALALSLPAVLPEISAEIQVMTFGVVLFTLLFQGLTMKPLVHRLGLIVRSEAQDEYERRHARAVANRAAYEHLDHRHQQGLLSDHTWTTIKPVLEKYNQNLADAVRAVLTEDPKVEAEELDTARRESLQAQRSAITSLLKDGVISEENYSQLVSEIDAAITKPQHGWSDLISSTTQSPKNINRLMAVIIQTRDIENALSALTKLGISVTQLPSKGGFLGRENATLLIGLSEGQEASTVEALNNACRKRVEYLTSPVDGFPTVLSAPIPVEVGGATIFTFEVEHFEVY